MPIGTVTPGSYVTVTPDTPSAPYASIQAPSPTMPVVAADIEALALIIMNVQHTETISANLSTVTGVPVGGRVFVSDGLSGWYLHAVASPFAAPYNVAGTTYIRACADGGVWIHEAAFAHAINRLPLIGPAPGDAYATLTSANRINKGVIDHGYFTHQTDSGAGHTFSTSSAVPVSLSALFADLGTLAGGDIVEFTVVATAVGSSAAAFPFFVWTEFSEDGGAVWVNANPQTAPAGYGLTADNLPHAVQLGFVRTVGPAGDFRIRFRGQSDGVNTGVLQIDSWIAKVLRP